MADQTVALFANWNPKATIKSLGIVRVYSFDNQMLGETKPLKINLKPGAFGMSTWKFA